MTLIEFYFIVNYRRYYWEVVETFRKLSQTGVVTLVSGLVGSGYQYVYALVLLEFVSLGVIELDS